MSDAHSVIEALRAELGRLRFDELHEGTCHSSLEALLEERSSSARAWIKTPRASLKTWGIFPTRASNMFDSILGYATEMYDASPAYRANINVLGGVEQATLTAFNVCLDLDRDNWLDGCAYQCSWPVGFRRQLVQQQIDAYEEHKGASELVGASSAQILEWLRLLDEDTIDVDLEGGAELPREAIAARRLAAQSGISSAYDAHLKAIWTVTGKAKAYAEGMAKLLVLRDA